MIVVNDSILARRHQKEFIIIFHRENEISEWWKGKFFAMLNWKRLEKVKLHTIASYRTSYIAHTTIYLRIIYVTFNFSRRSFDTNLCNG